MSEVNPEGVHALAESIAREIVARQGPGAPVALEALGDLTGSFTLAIKYNDTTYTLTVKIPTGSGGEYVFELTEKTGTEEAKVIASFKYKDGDNWAVTVTVPPIKFGDTITLETLELSVSSGSVTP